jgi:hypothetical protein
MRILPHTSEWRKNLSGIYGIGMANELLLLAQSLYDGFCARPLLKLNPSDQTALLTRVLPALSIYKAHLEIAGDKENALDIVDNLIRTTYFSNMANGIRLLNYLPDPFFIVKPVLKMMTRNEYVTGAQKIIEDNEDCFALHTYRCFIFDILKMYGVPELTVAFCNTDDFLAEQLPKVHFERVGTLGKGNPYCDFRWERLKK